MSDTNSLDNSRFVRFGLSVAVICAIADQLSKWWMLEGVFGFSFWPPQQGMPWTDSINLLPFFNLVTVWNQGVSFGMFSDSAETTRWILVAVTSLVALGMLVWLRKVQNKFLAFSLGLIIGGAVGNILDRIRFGAVFDFLDFFIGNWHWPAFNISDCAITVGAILVLLEGIIVKSDENA